jgi:hypothetical protein
VRERIRNEFAGTLETLERSDVAWLRSASSDALRLEVDFDVRSLYRNADGGVEERDGVVGVRYQLHPDHPQVPPIAVSLTPHLFNVHVHDPAVGASHLPPIPLFCLGPFLPQMRVSDWVVATYDLLRWARISTERPLNEAAAAFARRECAKPGRFPCDPRPFWRVEAETDAAAQPIRPDGTDSDAPGAEAAGMRLGSGWRAQ